MLKQLSLSDILSIWWELSLRQYKHKFTNSHSCHINWCTLILFVTRHFTTTGKYKEMNSHKSKRENFMLIFSERKTCYKFSSEMCSITLHRLHVIHLFQGNIKKTCLKYKSQTKKKNKSFWMKNDFLIIHFSVVC